MPVLLTELAEVARKQGRFGEAADRLQEARAAGADEAVLGRVLHLEGTLASQQGRYAEARTAYGRSLAVRERLADRASVGALLSNLAVVAEQEGDLGEAKRLGEQALAVREEVGEPWAVCVSHNNLGMVALLQRDFDTARGHIAESMRLAALVGDLWMVAVGEHNLGNALVGLGDLEGAGRRFLAALRTYVEHDDALDPGAAGRGRRRPGAAVRPADPGAAAAGRCGRPAGRPRGAAGTGRRGGARRPAGRGAGLGGGRAVRRRRGRAGPAGGRRAGVGGVRARACRTSRQTLSRSRRHSYSPASGSGGAARGRGSRMRAPARHEPRRTLDAAGRSRSSALLAVLLAGLLQSTVRPASAAPAGDLVVNGSFEEPLVPAGTFQTLPDGAVPGWRDLACGTEVQHGVSIAPFDGDQVVELASSCNDTVEQTVTVQAGQSYVLSYAYSPRPGVASNGMRVSVDGTTVATLDRDGSALPTSPVPPAGDWQTYTNVVRATGPTMVLSFTDTSAPEPAGSGLGAMLDAVSLVPVPVPYTDPAVIAQNTSWPNASGLPQGVATTGRNGGAGEARWYRFPVVPGSSVQVSVTGTTSDVDLTLFRDIGAAFTALRSPSDLARVSAESPGQTFAPSVYSPSVYSPSVYSPSVYSPVGLLPERLLAGVYSPSVYSPSVYSPSVYSPSVYSPQRLQPARLLARPSTAPTSPSPTPPSCRRSPARRAAA